MDKPYIRSKVLERKEGGGNDFTQSLNSKKKRGIYFSRCPCGLRPERGGGGGGGRPKNTINLQVSWSSG